MNNNIVIEANHIESNIIIKNIIKKYNKNCIFHEAHFLSEKFLLFKSFNKELYLIFSIIHKCFDRINYIQYSSIESINLNSNKRFVIENWMSKPKVLCYEHFRDKNNNDLIFIIKNNNQLEIYNIINNNIKFFNYINLNINLEGIINNFFAILNNNNNNLEYLLTTNKKEIEICNYYGEKKYLKILNDFIDKIKIYYINNKIFLYIIVNSFNILILSYENLNIIKEINFDFQINDYYYIYLDNNNFLIIISKKIIIYNLENDQIITFISFNDLNINNSYLFNNNNNLFLGNYILSIKETKLYNIVYDNYDNNENEYKWDNYYKKIKDNILKIKNNNNDNKIFILSRNNNILIYKCNI